MKTENPWLQIPAEDYEGHMSAPNVLQLQMLNKIFADVLNKFPHKSICILGCTTGNGFEHLTNEKVERIIGVDINNKFLTVCKKQYGNKLPKLELICADLTELDFPNGSFDLIHSALIFEYVDVDKLLLKIFRWLKPNGILSVVLQLPGETSAPVSETTYQSLKLLNPVMKLVNVEDLKTKAENNELNEIQNYKINLQTGKSFSVLILQK